MTGEDLGAGTTPCAAADATPERLAALLARAEAVARMGSWRLDLATGAVEWSDEMFRIFGVERRSIGLGAPEVSAFVHPDDRAAFDDAVARSERAGGPTPAEYRIVRPDGTVRWVHGDGEVERGPDGTAVAWVGFVQDVTGGREAAGSTARLVRAIEQANDSIVITDRDGAIEYVNPAFERATGYTRAEAVGANPRILKSGAHGPDFYAAMWATLAAGDTWSGEIVNRRKDGSVYTEEASIGPIRDEAGTTTAYVAVKRDISDRKQVEADLARARRLLDDAQAISGVGGWEYDVASGRIGWTDQVYRIHGVDRSFDPATVESDLTFYAPDDRAAVAEAFRRAVETGEPYDLEVRLDRADGRRIWVRTMGRPVVEGGAVVRVTGDIADITDRKDAESALRESERRFRLLFESLSAGFALHEMVRDADGTAVDYRFLQVNPAFEAVVGIAASALVGRTVLEVMPGTERAWIDRYAQVVETGEPAEFEDYARQLDRWYHVVAYRPEPERFAVLVDDVTDRRRAEAQLQEAQKLEAIGRLAGGIAHDFNNLLTVIGGAAEILSDETPTDDVRRGEVDTIREASERAAALTRQLLAFGRRQVLVPTVVDIGGVLAELAPMLRRTLGEDIELRLSVAPDTDPVRVDRGQLERVIVNLVFNARDAMPEGGVLTLATSRVTVSPDQARHHPGALPGRYTRLAVTDTGLGMPPDVVGRIFEPFFTTRPDRGGTGLGLATVEGIVGQSGGWIDVQSAPGSGTTFTIHLPCTGDAVDAAGPEPETVRPDAREVVLFVEDDTQVRAITSRMLRSLGYTVLEETSAEGAIARGHAGLEGVRVLVTDVVMPGLSGRHLSERLTRIRPGLRTLFVSGFSPDPQLEDRLRDPSAAFLAKPFTRDELAAALRDLLDDAARSPVRSPGR
jgi:PAS domain S-box-containing protein